MKDLLYRIVEVVEWHENENGRASGHCKISYFEQPNLHLPIKKLSEPNGELRFAESDVWLPFVEALRHQFITPSNQIINTFVVAQNQVNDDFFATRQC